MNPYYIYILSFLGVMLVYQFGWSDLYPSLSFSTIAFFLISFIIAYVIGRKFITKEDLEYNDIEFSDKAKYITIGVFVAYILEFIYAGGVPLFSSDIFYLNFQGIPIFHNFLYTFTIFYGSYLFHSFISTKNRMSLILYVLNFIPALLIISRGMIINILISNLFIFVSYIGLKKIFNVKIISAMLVVILIGFYGFGVLGNARVSKSDERFAPYSSEYIMDVGQASESFRKSIIPKPLFWSYLYVSSPLANLQLNIDEGKDNISSEDTYYYLLREIMPDIIARRISDDVAFDLSSHVSLITPELIVGSYYMGPFYYLGWIGMIISFLFIMLVNYVYIKLLGKNNILRTVGICMLCNVMVLNTFDNIIVFAGMSLQLLYPLLYRGYLEFKKYKESKSE